CSTVFSPCRLLASIVTLYTFVTDVVDTAALLLYAPAAAFSIPPLAKLLGSIPNILPTVFHRSRERFLFDLARGMYASPPVSGSAQIRTEPLARASIARWFSPNRTPPPANVSTPLKIPPSAYALGEIPVFPRGTVYTGTVTDFGILPRIFPRSILSAA